MKSKIVWGGIINGRFLVVREMRAFDDEQEKKYRQALGGLDPDDDLVRTKWYCGYIEIKPEDGEVYKLATQEDDGELDEIFPHAYRGITWSGETSWGGHGKVYVGFDTNHFLMDGEKPHSLPQTVSDVQGMLVDLLEWRRLH